MLTPTILQPLLAGLSPTLARGTDDPEAAAALLDSFHTETPLQAMLAAQAIALHHAAMDCFGRAMETEPEDHATAARLQRNAASLTRAFTATLRTLQRCQAEAAQAAAAGQQNLLQRERPVAPAKLVPAEAGSGAHGSPPDIEVAALDPRLREDDERAALSVAEHPLQRETPARQAKPAEPPHRRWEDLTEAQQFAILYPERVAAGATSHEDVDLWLTKPIRPSAPPRSAQ